MFSEKARRTARSRLWLLRSERGVAAVTVLLIIAVLGSLGALVLAAAQEDVRFGVLDTSAARALNRAEAGLEAAAEYLFLHGLLPSQTCTVSPASGTCFRLINPVTGGPDVEVAFLGADPDGEWVEYRVRSSAVVRGTRRDLQQVQRAYLLGLPYGLFIRGNLNFGGNPGLFNESVLVDGNVTGRDKVSFDVNGNNVSDDPDFGWIYHAPYVNTRGGPPPCTGDGCLVPAIKMCGTFLYPHLGPPARPVACAGVFAGGQISITAAAREIHTSPETGGWKNPELSDCGGGDCRQDRDSHQRVDAETPVVNVPDNLFIVRHLEELKRVSENQGLYFNRKGDGNKTYTFQPCMGSDNFRATTCPTPRFFDKSLVFFFDTDAGDTLKIKANLVPEEMKAEETGCGPTDFRQPGATLADQKSSESGIIIVRGGASVELESGSCWSGAIFNPDGNFRMAGGVVFVGTATVKEFHSTGTNTLKLSSSWFGRIPAGFRQIQRFSWIECEKFAAC